MAAHEAIAASPVAGTPDRGEMQEVLIERYGYIVKSGENPQDFDPQGEGGTGYLTLVIGFNGKWFWLDPADASTAHDGTTCIVTTATGGRYKVDGLSYLVIDVADKDLTAPPGSPSLGDKYIAGAAATGDWATHDDDIAIYTARGWEFITPGQGRIVFVADEAVFYHFTAGGAWVAGFGTTPLADDSVPLSAAINFGHLVIVENQTTTAPPGSPSTGDAYVIGASATGAWTGHDKKLAICEDGSTFTIYDRPIGTRIYDKSLVQDFRWDGTDWVSAGGYFSVTSRVYTSGATWTKPANLIGVFAHAVGGGGGGAGTLGAGTDGGSTSFGAHLVAGGGTAGGLSGSSGGGGVASAGDIQLAGEDGEAGSPSAATKRPGGNGAGPFGGGGGVFGAGRGPGGGGSSYEGTGSIRGGGGGAYAGGWLDAADLGSNETVTIGAGGAGGTSASAGADGICIVDEHIAS